MNKYKLAAIPIDPSWSTPGKSSNPLLPSPPMGPWKGLFYWIIFVHFHSTKFFFPCPFRSGFLKMPCRCETWLLISTKSEKFWDYCWSRSMDPKEAQISLYGVWGPFGSRIRAFERFEGCKRLIFWSKLGFAFWP